MIFVITLTKSYNKADFDNFIKYYSSLGITHIILNNESSFEIENQREFINGFPNQWKLFSNILNKNTYGFKDNDYIIFADDDEFFWYNHEKYSSFEECIDHYYQNMDIDTLLVPQIKISSRKYQKKRNRSYIETNTYRSNAYSSQGKVIIKYSTTTKYSFHKKDKETGHVPFLKYPDSNAYFRISQVVGSGLSKTTYGITDYEGDLRLYHYHFKSEEDWKKKWERGSAACSVHPYKENPHENYELDNYVVQDLTIKKEFQKLI